MKRIAYLIDKESVGGGMEYIRRQVAAHPHDECRVFAADRGECSVSVVDAWRPDEIIVSHLKALLALLGNPLRRPSAPVTFVVHGIHLRKYDFLPRSLSNRLKRFARRWLERRLYHRCARLIALTPTDAADVHRLYGDDLNVSIKPNTVDARDFERKEKLPWPLDAFAFVCIGRFDFQKGQDTLVRAIAAAQSALRAHGRRVLMIGDGATLPTVKAQAERLAVGDLIEFAGEIPSAGPCMACGRVLIAPSRWEGMPYLLLEAVARGRRVIATDCPGNRDVLNGYAGARLFPVEDVEALARLLEAES